jgi:hypothetical protein
MKVIRLAKTCFIETCSRFRLGAGGLIIDRIEPKDSTWRETYHSTAVSYLPNGLPRIRTLAVFYGSSSNSHGVDNNDENYDLT